MKKTYGVIEEIGGKVMVRLRVNPDIFPLVVSNFGGNSIIKEEFTGYYKGKVHTTFLMLCSRQSYTMLKILVRKVWIKRIEVQIKNLYL